MTRFLRLLAALAALAGVVGTVPAIAADLPAKAYATPTAAPASIGWTGLYLQGYGLYGANLSHADLTVEDTSFGDLASNPHGPGIGGAVGYNWQLSNGIVFGPRLELAYANLQGGGTLAQSLKFSNATNYLGSANLVLGIPLSPDGRLLGYLTGGFAWGGAKPNLNNVGLAATQIQAAASETSTGWDIGGGLAYTLDKNWSVFIEGDYYKLGDKSLTATIDGVPVATSTARYDIIVQKFGIGYRFGP